MCVCVCVCVCVCACVRAHIPTHIRVHMCICVGVWSLCFVFYVAMVSEYPRSYGLCGTECIGDHVLVCPR